MGLVGGARVCLCVGRKVHGFSCVLGEGKRWAWWGSSCVLRGGRRTGLVVCLGEEGARVCLCVGGKAHGSSCVLRGGRRTGLAVWVGRGRHAPPP